MWISNAVENQKQRLAALFLHHLKQKRFVVSLPFFTEGNNTLMATLNLVIEIFHRRPLQGHTMLLGQLVNFL